MKLRQRKHRFQRHMVVMTFRMPKAWADELACERLAHKMVENLRKYAKHLPANVRGFLREKHD